MLTKGLTFLYPRSLDLWRLQIEPDCARHPTRHWMLRLRVVFHRLKSDFDSGLPKSQWVIVLIPLLLLWLRVLPRRLADLCWLLPFLQQDISHSANGTDLRPCQEEFLRHECISGLHWLSRQPAILQLHDDPMQLQKKEDLLHSVWCLDLSVHDNQSKIRPLADALDHMRTKGLTFLYPRSLDLWRLQIEPDCARHPTRHWMLRLRVVFHRLKSDFDFGLPWTQ